MRLRRNIVHLGTIKTFLVVMLLGMVLDLVLNVGGRKIGDTAEKARRSSSVI
jgi:hypothetical protein